MQPSSLCFSESAIKVLAVRSRKLQKYTPVSVTSAGIWNIKRLVRGYGVSAESSGRITYRPPTLGNENGT